LLTCDRDVTYTRYFETNGLTKRFGDVTALDGLDFAVEEGEAVDEATLDEFVEAVEARCPVGDNIQHATDTDISIEQA
jgi:uncharacterized OsmC-like protein